MYEACLAGVASCHVEREARLDALAFGECDEPLIVDANGIRREEKSRPALPQSVPEHIPHRLHENVVAFNDDEYRREIAPREPYDVAGGGIMTATSWC